MSAYGVIVDTGGVRRRNTSFEMSNEQRHAIMYALKRMPAARRAYYTTLCKRVALVRQAVPPVEQVSPSRMPGAAGATPSEWRREKYPPGSAGPS